MTSSITVSPDPMLSHVVTEERVSMDLLVSLATVTVPISVQTVSVKTFALTEIAMGEERVQTALIPTPVSAMLATLVLIVRMILMSAC